ncbi:MAG TPA: GNAT family N-acetyltransferase [Solirubrobacteraceae bacterium]|nr:GNAT family N-acetyltransferase [Solirubrobacteraceae bacterium]
MPFRAIGPRITLRFAVEADAAALFTHARDPEVTRFFSWGPYERVEEAEAYIARLPAERAAGRHLDLLIDHREHGPIGVIGLGEWSLRDRRAVIGTWLGRAHWGTGANREAKAVLARLAFDALGLERIGAYAAPGNPRSQRALEKLGFVPEGTLREFHRHGEHVHDVRVYSLLRAEWAASELAQVPVQVEGEAPRAFTSSPPT